MLKLERVSLSLQGRKCLKSIDLHIANKGISVIIGSNGAGKTLLLKLCAGLLTPSSGTRYIDSNLLPLSPTPAITWVPDTPVLLDRTVLDNLLRPLIACKVEHPHERATQALQWADITDLSNLAASSLSAGEKQLVALARAWSLTPKLLLLDEPCANLDPNRQQQLEQLIRELDKTGCKVVMSSHHLPQAKRLADEIIFLDQGRVCTHASKEQFFSSTRYANQAETAKKIRQFIRYA